MPESSGDSLVFSGYGIGQLLRAVLGAGATFRFKARGRSMFPLVRDGDVLSVAPLPPEGVRSGDVVALILPGSGKLLIHRIVARQKHGYLVQGDARCRPDGIFPKSALAGRITAVERRGRRVWFGTGRWGRITAISVCKGVLPRILLPLYRRLVSVVRRLGPKCRRTGD